MTDGSELEKNEEKRLEEARKWQIETERSLAVAKAKEAHKLIEDTEKSRKRSAIMSICRRIFGHCDRILSVAGILLSSKSESPSFEIHSYHRRNIEEFMKIYESIRYDLLKTLEIKEEEMEKLFPKMSLDSSDFFEMIGKFHCMVYQMHDMVAYCNRILQ